MTTTAPISMSPKFFQWSSSLSNPDYDRIRPLKYISLASLLVVCVGGNMALWLFMLEETWLFDCLCWRKHGSLIVYVGGNMALWLFILEETWLFDCLFLYIIILYSYCWWYWRLLQLDSVMHKQKIFWSPPMSIFLPRLLLSHYFCYVSYKVVVSIHIQDHLHLNRIQNTHVASVQNVF